MLHRKRPQKTLGLGFVTFFQILLFWEVGGRGMRGVWAYGLLTFVTCSSVVYQSPCIDNLDRSRIYELLISICWLFLWNIIFINPTLTKSCQESLRWMSQSFVLKYYTIFQYFFRILVIPTLPLRALFNYNALLHSNGDHFFDFTWNRLLVPDKKSFGLWYREKPTSYWDFQGSLRVNIIVCLLQKTADITYAVVEQGNSMPGTAPKKPLRTYETEYVITMIYKPYFCGAVADPV